MNAEARRRITKARSQLLLRKPFFGFLSTHLEPIEDNHMLMPTMGTNGEKLYYDADFVEICTDEELQTIICHEVLHAALGHIWRRGIRNPMGWNLAADAVVNYHLEKQGFRLKDGCVRSREAETKSVEELYREMQGKGGGKSGTGEMQGELMDDHKSWDKPTGDGSDGKSAGGKSKQKDMTVEELKGLQDKWKQLTAQARQIEKSQGREKGSLDELIDDLLEPKLSWKDLLRNAVISSVKNDYRFIPPNKRHLWRGMYLPSAYGEEMEIVYAIDTSGSMSTSEIREGLSELKGVCDAFQSYKIHLFQADADVQQYLELTPYNFDFPKKIRGRGGTSFVPVFEDVAKRNIHPSILVYFTDGYGTIPTIKPYYSVLWLITERGVSEGDRYWEEMKEIGTCIRYEGANNK